VIQGECAPSLQEYHLLDDTVAREKEGQLVDSMWRRVTTARGMRVPPAVSVSSAMRHPFGDSLEKPQRTRLPFEFALTRPCSRTEHVSFRGVC
jgi:hypothetical protein